MTTLPIQTEPIQLAISSGLVSASMINLTGSYRAAWLVPVESPPIRNGVVTVENGIIVSLESNVKTKADEINLGQVALLPGLVNAHTHLEFSNLKSPLGNRGMPFTDWVKLVVQYKSRELSASELLETKSQAIKKGIAESIESGVVHIGEIATHPFSPIAYKTTIGGSRVTAFLELLGRGDDPSGEKLSIAQNDLQDLSDNSVLTGLSPHAPYSVGPKLFQHIISMANSGNLPVAMHLAESRSELELLKNVDGPFVELLTSLKAWNPDSFIKGSRPLDYLKMLSELPRVLVVHGNYLDDEELALIANTRYTMSVVYCPRTHQYFGHEQYRLEEMLKLGINVALGTDSRASSPDLSLLAEMQSVMTAFPHVKPQKIVELGTLAGAKALHLDNKIGSLKPGKLALFAAVEIEDAYANDPFAAIVNSPRVLPGPIGHAC